ncbi:hypothetical protein Droror1_Dr00018656 [Drosera rotundifolia]
MGRICAAVSIHMYLHLFHKGYRSKIEMNQSAEIFLIFLAVSITVFAVSIIFSLCRRNHRSDESLANGNIRRRRRHHDAFDNHHEFHRSQAAAAAAAASNDAMFAASAAAANNATFAASVAAVPTAM